MVGGVALALLAPNVGLAILGLLAFGVGVGGVYAAALYYAMAVGASEVDAGGKHEATIGAGYTIGPLAALVGVALAEQTELLPDANAGALALVGILTIAALGAAVRSAIITARKTTPDPRVRESGALR